MHGHGQGKLVPGQPVTKIAQVDYAQILYRYQPLKTAREKAKQDWIGTRSLFEQDWQTQEEAIRQQMRQDSLTGGKKKEQLKVEAENKRKALKGRYDQKFKQLDADWLVRYGEIEQRIWEAAQQVVYRNGFTEIRLVEGQNPPQEGTNITEQILHQLN
jgi:Skp family chaperone for outer membrane proteins